MHLRNKVNLINLKIKIYKFLNEARTKHLKNHKMPLDRISPAQIFGFSNMFDETQTQFQKFV